MNIYGKLVYLHCKARDGGFLMQTCARILLYGTRNRLRVAIESGKGMKVKVLK